MKSCKKTNDLWLITKIIDLQVTSMTLTLTTAMKMS
jgi:hypothetical protein